ncbi:MAG: GNAT family N-acetyltransferase [Candidatus Thorarchaeota archaeon]
MKILIGDKIKIGNEELIVREWDFKEDAERVSSLLELVFENELQSKGLSIQALFEEFRTLQPFLKFIGMFSSNFKHALDGFVVENQNKEIISSVNVGYALSHWEIAMVATHPDYRRKGLARLLVTKGIEHAKNLGAKMCVLEVLDINEPAYNLYKSLKFIHYDSVTRKKLEPEYLEETLLVELPEEYLLSETKRNKKTNQARYELDLRVTPDKVQEFHPVNRKKYHKPFLIRMIRPIVRIFIKIKSKDWIVYREDKLVATLSSRVSNKQGSPHRIDLMIDIDHRENLVEPLLSYCLDYIKKNKINEQNTIIEMRSSDKEYTKISEKYNFQEIETMHLLGLKL